MSIPLKLFFIVLIVTLGALAVFGVYMVSNTPMRELSSELGVLEQLEDSLKDTRIDVALVDSVTFVNQLEKIRKGLETLESSFDAVSGLKRIPGLNQDTADAVESIFSLKELLLSDVSEMNASVAPMIEDVEAVFMTTRYFKIFDFYISASARLNKNGDMYAIHLDRLLSSLFALDLDLEASISQIEKQKTTINDAIKASKARTMIITLAISLLLMALVFLIVQRIAIGIVRTIRAIESRIKAMTEGDLTVEFPSGSKDELGRLSSYMNDFTSSLRDSVRNIAQGALNNLAVEEELSASSAETSASIAQIDSGAQFIRKQMDRLDGQVRGANDEMDFVLKSAGALDGRLQDQTSMVEESTASVTEMIASITSVADITNKKREATEKLVETAREGGERLEATNAVITEITSSIDDISSTAELIQGIASQTNLLAMNAAIEAAHAGEAGKGFSVVAEEIRKLAEAASENSTHISGILKQIVARIEEAAAAGRETGESFEAINVEVKDVVHSFTEIASNMAELSTGSREILSAMTALRDLSLEVKQDGRNMAEATQRSQGSMAAAEQISAEVLGSVTEMVTGINEVSGAVSAINTLAGRVRAVSQELDEAVRLFSTETDATETGVADDTVVDPDTPAA